MDHAKVAEEIRTFLLEAGAHALKLQKSIDPQYKKNNTIVTQADLDISHMAQEKLSHYFEQEGHVLIDEESIDTISSPENVFTETRYQWVLDPIDGTAGYALGRDRWGVSLGFLEEGVPVGGGIYLPAIGALIMVEDGQAVYTNTVTGEKNPIPQAQPMELNSQIYVESHFGFENHWKKNMGDNKVWLNTPECALQGGYSALMRHAAATTFMEMYSIWDMAGIAAIARVAGYKIMALEDGHTLEKLAPQYFSDKWKLKNKWIMAHPDNYPALKNTLTGK